MRCCDGSDGNRRRGKRDLTVASGSMPVAGDASRKGITMMRHIESSRPWVSNCFRHSSRKVLTLAALLIMLACLGGPGEAAAQFLSKGNGNLRVMTYNVDEGTDFLEIQQATNLNQFLVAVGQTITQVRATNSPARMQAVAKQIIAAGPRAGQLAGTRRVVYRAV